MKRILIGIDGNEANIENRVGVNQYAFEVLKGLYGILSDNKDVFFRIYLKNKPLGDLPREKENWEYEVIPGGGAWIIRSLMPRLFREKEKLSVFFSLSHYAPLVAPCPRVVAIMDLDYLENSEQFRKRDFWQLKYWTARSISVSKYIISISEATKRDIVRHYPKAAKKVVVTHLGYDKDRYNTKILSKNVRRVEEKYKVFDDSPIEIEKRGYILFLSTLKPSKNVEGLIEAWSLVASNFPQVKLVIAGKKGWLYDSIFRKVIDLGLEKQVVFTGFIDEEDKPALVNGARLFVAPSFWEGFGLQVLEAMACGIPVVVSDRGSLPEVVGKAGVIVDPENTAQMAKEMEKVLMMDKKGYDDLVSKGLKQAQKFDWEKTARKTLEILRKAGEK